MKEIVINNISPSYQITYVICSREEKKMKKGKDEELIWINDRLPIEEQLAIMLSKTLADSIDIYSSKDNCEEARTRFVEGIARKILEELDPKIGDINRKLCYLENISPSLSLWVEFNTREVFNYRQKQEEEEKEGTSWLGKTITTRELDCEKKCRGLI